MAVPPSMVEIYSRPLVSQFREREYQKSPSPNLKHFQEGRFKTEHCQEGQVQTWNIVNKSAIPTRHIVKKTDPNLKHFQEDRSLTWNIVKKTDHNLKIVKKTDPNLKHSEEDRS